MRRSTKFTNSTGSIPTFSLKCERMICQKQQHSKLNKICLNMRCNNHGLVCSECIIEQHDDHVQDCIKVTDFERLMNQKLNNPNVMEALTQRNSYCKVLFNRFKELEAQFFGVYQMYEDIHTQWQIEQENEQNTFLDSIEQMDRKSFEQWIRIQVPFINLDSEQLEKHKLNRIESDRNFIKNSIFQLQLVKSQFTSLQSWLKGYFKGVNIQDIDVLANNQSFLEFFDQQFNFKHGSIDLNNQSSLSAQQIEALIKVGKCHDITKIDLSFTQIDDEGLGLLSLQDDIDQCLMSFSAGGCKYLTQLSIADFCQQLDLNQLQELSLWDSSADDSTLRAIQEKVRFLQQLDLSGCINMTSKGFWDFFDVIRNLDRLEYINLRGTQIGDGSLEHLAKQTKEGQLAYINFGECQEVTENGLKYFIQDAKFENIIEIHLSKTSLDDACLDQLASQLTEKIQVLNLRECVLPTGNGWSRFFTQAKISNISHLNLQSTLLSDQSFDSLQNQINNSKTLVSLNLSYCQDVSVKGFKALFEGTKLPHLRDLFLINSQIDDEVLKLMKDSIENLEKLFFASNPTVTSDGFHQFFGSITKIHNLSTIDLRYSNIDHKGIELLLQKTNPQILQSIQLNGCKNVSSQILEFAKNQYQHIEISL